MTTAQTIITIIMATYTLHIIRVLKFPEIKDKELDTKEKSLYNYFIFTTFIAFLLLYFSLFSIKNVWIFLVYFCAITYSTLDVASILYLLLKPKKEIIKNEPIVIKTSKKEVKKEKPKKKFKEFQGKK